MSVLHTVSCFHQAHIVWHCHSVEILGVVLKIRLLLLKL